MLQIKPEAVLDVSHEPVDEHPLRISIPGREQVMTCKQAQSMSQQQFRSLWAVSSDCDDFYLQLNSLGCTACNLSCIGLTGIAKVNSSTCHDVEAVSDNQLLLLQ